MNGSVQIVLVLFRCLPQDSETFRSLCQHQGAMPGTNSRILLYDNTDALQSYDESEITRFFEVPIVCRRNPANSGLAAAYNEGVELAMNAGLDWVVLLDQDTRISREYLNAVADGVSRFTADFRVAAMVPRIRSARSGNWISPARVIGGNLQVPVAQGYAPRSGARYTAINSGTVVRTAFIRSQGGYTASFPLDMLDHWFFYQVFRSGKRIVLLNAVLEHDLSVSRMREVDSSRIARIFLAEREFYRRHARFGHRVLYRLRSAVRLLKYFLLPGYVRVRRSLTGNSLHGVMR